MKYIGFIVIAFIMIGNIAFAQKPNTKTNIAKIKVYETVWGGLKGNNITITPEIARDVIQKNIVVVDEKRTPMPIVRFSLLYRKFGMAEEETEDGPTGKPIPTYTTSIGDFTNNKLTPSWITNTTDQLKKGDELVLFDIVIKDANGRNAFAPQLKILIR
jgi:hypothetical protein